MKSSRAYRLIAYEIEIFLMPFTAQAYAPGILCLHKIEHFLNKGVSYMVEKFVRALPVR